MSRWLLVLGVAARAAAMTVTPSGPPVSVWGSIDALHKCGVNDVPDIPARAFVDGDNVTHMIVGSTSFHWMTGPSVFKQTRNCTPAWNSTQDPNPAHFASAVGGEPRSSSGAVYRSGRSRAVTKVAWRRFRNRH